MTAADQHPHWCTGEGCGTRGWHASATLIIHADARTTGQDLAVDRPAAAVRLVQLVAADAEPYITVNGARTLTGAGDEGPAMVLSVRQVRILRRFLHRLTEEAER